MTQWMEAIYSLSILQCDNHGYNEDIIVNLSDLKLQHTLICVIVCIMCVYLSFRTSTLNDQRCLFCLEKCQHWFPHSSFSFIQGWYTMSLFCLVVYPWMFMLFLVWLNKSRDSQHRLNAKHYCRMNQMSPFL